MQRMIPFIRLRFVWYSISLVLLIVAVAGLVFRGIPYGIDFTGGALMEIAYTKETPSLESIQQAFTELGLPSASAQRVEGGYIIRLPVITEDQHNDVLKRLRAQIGQTTESNEVSVIPTGESDSAISGVNLTFDEGEVSGEENRLVEHRYDTIGPVIGQELKTRSVQASIIVLLAILAFIALSFRKISWPVKSWKYGVVAIAALFHDLVITLGAFVWASSFFAWDVDTTFVAALLTVLGYSVSDRIVVFDRVRENLPRMDASFEEVVNASINQTLLRSLSTGFTTLLMMVSILFFGGESLRPFMFTLIVGILLGTYSSIFIASPLLVSWYNRSSKKAR